MNIKGQGNSLILSKAIHIQRFQTSFFLETAGQIEAKFHVESPWDGETKIYSNGPGHMTKMAAMPIYGNNLTKTFFSGTKRPMTMKLGMQHRVLKYYQTCSNDDPGLTDLFYGKDKFGPLCFCMGKR